MTVPSRLAVSGGSGSLLASLGWFPEPGRHNPSLPLLYARSNDSGRSSFARCAAGRCAGARQSPVRGPVCLRYAMGGKADQADRLVKRGVKEVAAERNL